MLREWLLSRVAFYGRDLYLDEHVLEGSRREPITADAPAGNQSPVARVVAVGASPKASSWRRTNVVEARHADPAMAILVGGIGNQHVEVDPELERAVCSELRSLPTEGVVCPGSNQGGLAADDV